MLCMISRSAAYDGMLDSQKIAVEAQHGLIAQIIKDVVFSSRLGEQGKASNVEHVVDVLDATMSIG